MPIKLTNDIEILIMKSYFSKFVLSHIKQQRQSMFEYLCEDFTDDELTPELKENLMDLTNIGDLMALNRFIPKDRMYMEYIFESIQIPLEMFLSLSLVERQTHIENSRKYRKRYYNSFGSQHNYFQDLYTNSIDNKRKSKSHSGFSFGYCLKNLMPFITGDEQDKQNLWRTLLRSYLVDKIY